MKKHLSIIFLGLFSLLSFNSNAHKFYMSICNIEYNQQTKSLEIVVKFFVDDFENVLERESGDPIFIGQENENWKADEYIENYFRTNFQISQNGEQLENQYIGKEIDKNYAWVYIEIKNYDSSLPAGLKNSLLLDYYEDQTNKVNYKIGDKTKSFTLHINKTKQEF